MVIILASLLLIPIIPYEREISKGVIAIEYQPVLHYAIKAYKQGR